MVFSCKFAARFQNTFFKEHPWVAAFEFFDLSETQQKKKFLTYFLNIIHSKFQARSYFIWVSGGIWERKIKKISKNPEQGTDCTGLFFAPQLHP